MLNIDDLKKELEYQPDSGNFIRLVTRTNSPKGSAVGCMSKLDSHDTYYIRIGVLGRYYKAHRLAFFYMTGRWPKGQIDHIDHNSLNNAWNNLREVTSLENGKNQKKYISNTSGVTGVRQRSNGKWRARIYHEGVHIDLGTFIAFEDAVEARQNAEKRYGFHENHGK